jgi:hypothetical protein
MSVLRDEFRDPRKIIAIEDHVFGRSNDQTIDLQELEAAGKSVLAREFCERWFGHGSGKTNVGDDPDCQVWGDRNDPIGETGARHLKRKRIIARKEWIIRVTVP